MSGPRFTLTVCLVAILGGVGIGLIPLGTDGGLLSSGGDELVGSRLRDDPHQDTELRTRASDPFAMTGSTLVAAPADTAPEPSVLDATITAPTFVPPTFDWLRRLSGRATPNERARAASTPGRGTTEAPSDAAGPVFDPWPTVVDTTPTPTPTAPPTTGAPPRPPSTTSPPPPTTTTPPTTEPPPTTTEPPPTTTEPPPPTTEPPTTLPDPPVDPLP